jgi:branched-subunit amino acid ABC-type transport system permease component/ABC-type branched-subunit amino acid transport system substrate-binding protein
MVYIGTYNSGAAKVSMPILNQAGLLMISPANTSPGLTKTGLGEPGEPEVYFPSGKRNYVRVVPADDLQGTLAADWAFEMGVKSVYIIDDTEVYGKGIANMFEERCEELSIRVLGHESIDANSQEFKSLMTTIKSKQPDLIYFGGTTQTKGGQLAKDMVTVGVNAKLMAPDGCFEESFIQSAGEAALNDRCFITFGGLPPESLTGKGAEFAKKYQAKHGVIPQAYAIYGYEAANVALEAIRRANKKDRAAIVDAAFKIKDFDGALGKWSFDANGDTSLTTISGNKVSHGKFEFVKLLEKNDRTAAITTENTLQTKADPSATPSQLFLQYCLDGLTFGALIALIALGYTMVYGIIGLINFAHGDLFMLGAFLALSITNVVLSAVGNDSSWFSVLLIIVLSTLGSALFCATLNVTVDQLVYRPLRHAPKLAPLVSAIGVSFVFMNLGQLWRGVADINFPNLFSDHNLLAAVGITGVHFTVKDAFVVSVTVPILLLLMLLVNYTKLGKAMRATEQNTVAAQLMGINVHFVVASTFALGGALAGIASVVYALSINTISYQMGFQNGLYAFTAAVLGGIGKLQGAVLGGLIIGVVRQLGSPFLGETWTNALIFAILIVILVFRPAGLLGSTARDKV